jgi:hypothetical protein
VIDPATGLPAGIELPEASDLAPLVVSSSISLVVGGGETRALHGGLDYPGTEVLSDSRVGSVQVVDERGAVRQVSDLAGPPLPAPGHATQRVDETFVDMVPAGALRVATELSTWSLTLNYEAARELPRARLGVELQRAEGDERPLRNVELELMVHLESPESWLLHAPGNPLAPGTCVADLHAELAVSSATGSLGSIGLVALSHRDHRACVLFWPFSRTEIGWITLAPVPGGLTIRVTTNLAGDPAPGETLAYAGLNFDAVAASWPEVRGRIRPALTSLGVKSPGAKPAWAGSVAIYEVQVGRSVFSGGYSYEPYPRLDDLTADLERIAGLGFNAIQLMPRQPYPGYNVHDYDDTATTYGGDETLRALVVRAHELGLRVILDMIMAGVVDRRAVRTALQGVEESGVLDTPAPTIGDVFAGTAESYAALQRAWCQHIADFAPYWIEGSPEIHPLTTLHPDWFCRDSSGELTGIYHEAFDFANEEWQEWFCGKALALVERFSIDGFRFDAPTYNNFANWSKTRRSRASASTLGCVGLFARLRRAIRARYPELLMYTEPSGVVLRESMDMNYNYDELWLVPALTAGSGDPASVGNGVQLARWLEERNATLPADALTAHHLDSHDTFWWPAPGRKWRREQIGVPAARALMWCLVLCGGPYMMFVGGESGMEEDLRRTMSLRRERAELRTGAADYSSVSVEDEAVFAVVRDAAAVATLVLVNVSPRPVTSACRLGGGWRVASYEDYYAGADGLRPGPEGSFYAELAPYGLALVELER